MSPFAAVLERLAQLVADRVSADPEQSYTAQLLADPVRAAKKLGEEAIETVIAAIERDQDAIARESADLIYHWLVLLESAGVPLEAVAAELERREGVSGLDEKAGRKN